MTHFKLTLAYDGTAFHGWQIQPTLPTIQGLLADAIHRIAGERVLPQGSGRTDAGVHALAQVASVAIEAPIPAANLHRALNRCLPPSVRVLTVEVVPPGFHARHNAVRKTYEYRIFPLRASSLEPRPPTLHPRPKVEENICPPILAPFVWPCPWPLDLSALDQAARHVLGTHDFTTFAATDPDLTARNEEAGCVIHRSSIPMSGSATPPHLATTNIRTISHSAWHTAGDIFIYRVTANGFLHHMVRNLVGTFVQAGAHRLDPESISTLLEARNRAAAGPTAPASGLFLLNVEYPDLEPEK